MSIERVTKLLEDIRSLSDDRYQLVQSVRKLTLGLDASISEEVKYGGILFAAGKPFCGIFSYRNHVSLEFSEGASLQDKYKVLEGDGKLRRHIKLTTLQDVDGKHVRDYLVLAHKAATKK
jgi:hypothetical protein